jgi:phospholipase/carboxylesterase
MVAEYIGEVMRRLTTAGLDVMVAGGEDREGGGDGPLVVLCHGFGAPGEDLVPLFRQLAVPREVRFAFPAAPLDLGATLGQAYRGGRAWWMIDPKSLEEAQRGVRRDRSHVVPDGLVEARKMVTELLDELGRLLTAPPARTILGGFSQGAMVSLDVALRLPHRLAGLCLMSGSIVAVDEWQPLLATQEGVPVVQSHGRADPLLPFDVAERLRDLLRGAGADVRWVEFSGGHTITGTVLDALGGLINEVAGRTP